MESKGNNKKYQSKGLWTHCLITGESDRGAREHAK